MKNKRHYCYREEKKHTFSTKRYDLCKLFFLFQSLVKKLQLQRFSPNFFFYFILWSINSSSKVKGKQGNKESKIKKGLDKMSHQSCFANMFLPALLFRKHFSVVFWGILSGFVFQIFFKKKNIFWCLLGYSEVLLSLKFFYCY